MFRKLYLNSRKDVKIEHILYWKKKQNKLRFLNLRMRYKEEQRATTSHDLEL